MKYGQSEALLTAAPDVKSNNESSSNRVFPVTVKLTKDELEMVNDFSKSKALARGEWIRDVILKEILKSSASDPSLAEILGVRLLLVNVLRPLAAGQQVTNEVFDKLLDEISIVKHQLASKIAFASGRK